MSTHIEKQIELCASVSRVWQALTDYQEFGKWFRVKLDHPFSIKQSCRGQILHPGYEHHQFSLTVEKIEPEHLFSYTWHPYALDKERDYSSETPTLVEFHLKKTTHGTLLTLKESGFDSLPADRRAEAFRMNESGWSEQMRNIQNYVEKTEVH